MSFPFEAGARGVRLNAAADSPIFAKVEYHRKAGKSLMFSTANIFTFPLDFMPQFRVVKYPFENLSAKGL
jgi:hypothetical protein